MGSDDKNLDQTNTPSPSSSISSPSDPSLKERILIPTLLAGVAGGAVGLISKHRKVHGLSKISATYATNLAIVTGCYCGAREFMRVSVQYSDRRLWQWGYSWKPSRWSSWCCTLLNYFCCCRDVSLLRCSEAKARHKQIRRGQGPLVEIAGNA